jgi:hypothetical protein
MNPGAGWIEIFLLVELRFHDHQRLAGLLGAHTHRRIMTQFGCETSANDHEPEI